jgi:hypothetical protein
MRGITPDSCVGVQSVNLSSPTYHPKSDTKDRRRSPRTALDAELLVLDALSGKVKHVLVGEDLSPHGIRVEPHPGIALGDRMQLAFLEEGHPEPVKLQVEAARDDGDLGWLLRFVELNREMEVRIQRLLRTLPAVQSFGSPPEDSPKGVALARIQPKSVLA